MLSLDDGEDLVAERMIGSVEAAPRRRVSLRPFLMGLLVLVLGGGLGAGAYLLSDMDTRDLIALLDIGDQPRLALQLPGLSPSLSKESPPAVPTAGPLLTPPGAPSLTPPANPAATALANSGEMPPAAPASPGGGEAAGVAAMPMTPPLKPEAPVLPPPPPVIAPAVPTGPVPAAPPAAVPAQPMPAQPIPAMGYQAPTYASLPNRFGEAKPLPPAPVESLLRQSAYGPLPVATRDKLPWKTYARPFDAPPGKPRMAVVVTGLGMDKDATDAAITKLPPEVTLAFDPYAGALDKWVKKARDFGHEVMLMLPAEAIGFPARDPGPWGLLVGNPPEENIARLEQVLARAPGAIGVLAPGGAFVRSPKLSVALMALKERGLVFIGDGAKVDVDLPNAAVTATLDVDLFRDAIEARLSGAARAAKDAGGGLVVVSPRPVAFDRLLGWLDRLGDQGLVLAPASGVVKQSGKS